MKCAPARSALAGLVFAVAIVALAALVPLRPLSAAADPPDAFVVNSGSTNMLGYKIDVPRAGDASYQQGDQTGHGPLDPALVKQLYDDIAAASPLADLPRGHCRKSASFGTTTRVIVGDDQSPDVSCPGNDQAAALYDDAKKIAASLQIKNQPRHPVQPPG